MRNRPPQMPFPNPERLRSAPAYPAIPLPPCNRTGNQTQGSEESPVILTLSFPLECITPVVGGGVEGRMPDELEALRISGIRGQLRMWWRALQKPDLTSKALFEQEFALWGGVSGEEKKKEGQEEKREGKASSGDAKAARSRVNLRVKVVQSGQLLPAGRYEGSGGQYKALPNWDGGPAMGYGLFPLQYERDEMRMMTQASPPTRPIRHGLKFNLLVTLRLPKDEQQAKTEIKTLLETFWAWIHYGGIGARTTRGFGALGIRMNEKEKVGEAVSFQFLAPAGEREKVKVLETLLLERRGLFQPPAASGIRPWLEKARQHFPNAAGLPQAAPLKDTEPFRPRLPARNLVCGQTRPTAREALVDGLDQLKQFRQGPGFGRRPGSPRPGRSFWPEADTLRRLAKKKRKASFGLHEPESTDEKHDAAPRAAFGMPLNITFKDSADAVANGAMVPTYGSRWTSPLRMRPLHCTDGFVCWMIYLQQPFPEVAANGKPNHVAAVLPEIKRDRFDEVEKPVPLLNYAGAKPPVHDWLKRGNGDAVQAFLLWLTGRGFRAVEVK